VCTGGTRSAFPIDFIVDNGYRCPKGHYCPEGSFLPVACAAGSHNPDTMSSNHTDCRLCGENLYQHDEGQAECMSCSTSSTSTPGSALCDCIGLNRAFQTSDGFCICKPGFEFYDENFAKQSDEDGDVDCQPVVYSRCLDSEVRDLYGNCRAADDCSLQCGEAGGKYVGRLGVCECNGVDDLNSVCSKSCREDSNFVSYDFESGQLVSRNTTHIHFELSPTDIPNMSGELSCSSDAAQLTEDYKVSCKSPYDPSCASAFSGCNVFSVSSSESGFAGVFGSVLDDVTVPPDNFDGRRRLGDNETGTDFYDGESAHVRNPVICLQLGDSILYKVTKESYPQYEKDSLLNTNPNFDYGPFRELDDMAKSTSDLDYFGHSFDDPGVYVHIGARFPRCAFH
jgi:hypothetical protein